MIEFDYFKMQLNLDCLSAKELFKNQELSF